MLRTRSPSPTKAVSPISGPSLSTPPSPKRSASPVRDIDRTPVRARSSSPVKQIISNGNTSGPKVIDSIKKKFESSNTVVPEKSAAPTKKVSTSNGSVAKAKGVVVAEKAAMYEKSFTVVDEKDPSELTVAQRAKMFERQMFAGKEEPRKQPVVISSKPGLVFYGANMLTLRLMHSFRLKKFVNYELRFFK